jgi:hypothetical protein
MSSHALSPYACAGLGQQMEPGRCTGKHSVTDAGYRAFAPDCTIFRGSSGNRLALGLQLALNVNQGLLLDLQQALPGSIQVHDQQKDHRQVNTSTTRARILRFSA